MASHIEMQRLAQNPAAVVTLAEFLRGLPDVGWTEWEVDFLDAMVRRDRDRELSTRQREKLIELRDDAINYTKFDGLSVASLVRDCWIARLDLTDDDEAFVADLKGRGVTSLKRRPVMRLLRCARELGLVDGFVEIG